MSSIRCICQICTCGRHRCPHRPNNDPLGARKGSAPCKLSEYGTKFNWTTGKPRESLKPKQRALSQDSPMATTTIQKVDYVAHPIRISSPKPKPAYMKPPGKVEKDSEYSMKYTGEQVPPPPMIKPTVQHKILPEQVFQGNTTQKTDFVDWGAPQPERHGEQKVYEPPAVKFNAMSTVQADYVNNGAYPPPQSMKPLQKPKTSTEPFDCDTNYKQDFKAHQLPPKFVQGREVYQPKKGGFSGVTTFKSDFRQHSAYKPSPSMKPKQAAVKSDQAFDSKTVQNSDFRAWELPAKQKRTPAVYSPPTEKFPSRSTFRDDYKDYGFITPSKSMRPVQIPLSTAEPFQSSTIQKLDYQSWPMDSLTKPIIHGKEYQAPMQKFNAQSTFQNSFQGKFGLPAESAKPPQVAAQGGGRMDGTTMYNSSYSPKGINSPCPTAFFKGELDTTSRYLYSHQDNMGHKFFAPLQAIAQDAAKYTATTGQA